MKAVVKLGIVNAVAGVAILILAMGVVYPLTKSIIVYHMPIMTWGFVIIGLGFVVQCYVFMGKMAKLEKAEEKNEGGGV